MNPMRSLLLALLLLPAMAAPAAASDYLLSDVSLVSEVAQTRLAESGVTNTRGLLEALLTPSLRAAMLPMLELSAAETLALARQLELLQLEGVGPKASQLLIAAGVTSVADLAKREPASLLAPLAVANDARAIAGVNPSIEHVTQWVEAAGKATLHLVEE